MSDVNDLWDDEVDVAEWGPADFESRKSSISIYDGEMVYRTLSERLGEAWGLDAPAAADRAVRIYIGHVLDSRETLDLRAEANQHVLVPPSGWVAHNRDVWAVPMELPEPRDPETRSDRQFVPSTSETVSWMVGTLVDDYDQYDARSDFAKAALRFVSRIDDED